MPPADGADLVRIVIGRSGRMAFRTELVVRFNYGAIVPWVNRLEDGAINAIAGPERLVLRTPVKLYGEDLKTMGDFTVDAGESVPFVLSHGLSFQSPPPAIDPFDALERTTASWCEWSDRCPDVGPWTDSVKRSLITLKALTYAPTGGIVAAATTSLPERLGGVRNKSAGRLREKHDAKARKKEIEIGRFEPVGRRVGADEFDRGAAR